MKNLDSAIYNSNELECKEKLVRICIGNFPNITWTKIHFREVSDAMAKHHVPMPQLEECVRDYVDDPFGRFYVSLVEVV